MAQLIIDGKSYGPHAFVVPIRDLKTHKPLPGVTVGDVGPKFGLNTLDNGFVLFDKVRIPHDYMLAKYSHVVKETGVYERPPNAKIGYGTMVSLSST
jgi:acyl-CoA oxidase